MGQAPLKDRISVSPPPPASPYSWSFFTVGLSCKHLVWSTYPIPPLPRPPSDQAFR